MPLLAALAQCAMAGTAAAIAWQAADVRRLHAQAEAAWQDVAAVRASRDAAAADAALAPRMAAAVLTVERYAADVTARYHRRLSQVPARWIAALWRMGPRIETVTAAAPERTDGPWG